MGWWKNILLAGFVIGLIIFGSYMTIQHTNSTRAVSEMDGAIRSALLGQARGMGDKVGIDKDEFAGAVVEGIVNTQKNHKKTVQVDYVFLNAKGEKTEESEKIKSVQYRIHIINKKGEKQSRAVKNLALSEYGEDRVIDIDRTKVKYVNFESGKDMARTATVTIPGLKGVSGVTVDNGNVSYTVNGETITIKVTNGDKTTKVTGSYVPEHTKYVSGQASSYYNKDEYVGNLTEYNGGDSILPEESKHVTGQTSSSYNSGGYATKPGEPLTRYVHSGEYIPSQDKYVTNQLTNWYNDGVYSGYLSQYLYSGSYTASDTKYVSGHSSSYYSSGGYTGNLNRYLYSGGYVEGDTKYVSGQDNQYYNQGGYTGTLEKYIISGEYIPGETITEKNGGQTYSWNLGCNAVENWYSQTTGKFEDFYIDTCVPTTDNYGNKLWFGVYKRDFVIGGKDTRVYKYRGYVTKPAIDTRIYLYEGYVTKPGSDTRVYRYQGTVTKPAVDTRLYRYQGMVYKKGTSSTNKFYQGYVTKPSVDTRKEEGTYKYGVTIRYK